MALSVGQMRTSDPHCHVACHTREQRLDEAVNCIGLESIVVVAVAAAVRVVPVVVSVAAVVSVVVVAAAAAAAVSLWCTGNVILEHRIAATTADKRLTAKQEKESDGNGVNTTLARIDEAITPPQNHFSSTSQ